MRPRRRPAARLRRRRQRQDARHHVPHREPRRARPRPAVPHPRGDLHQQGRRRDAGAPRRPRSARTSRATSGSARSTRRARELLRRDGEAAGLARSFVIYDDGRSEAPSMSRVFKRARPRREALPAAAGPRRASTPRSRRGAVPTRCSADDFVDDAIAEVLRAYEQRLRAANAVDFDDLILHVLQHARGPETPAGASRHAPAGRLPTTCSSTSSRTRTRCSTGS